MLRSLSESMLTLRKLSRREATLLGLVVVAGIALGWRLLGGTAEQRAAQERRATEIPGPLPRIDLARLGRPAASSEAGRRNLFDFGPAPAPETTPPPVVVATPPPVVPAPPPATGLDGLATASGPPPLPPLNVKYIGSVENATGVKVAVLVTDRNEVLTGQTGQVIANRYRVARIGLESVDLEDVTTGQPRRIALRGS